jgi:hypothetical protein
MTDNRNKYAHNPLIKWIFARAIDGGEWVIICLSGSSALDTTPIGVMAHSRFGLFRNVENWWEHKPYQMIDCRDHSHDAIGSAVGSLVNAVNSDFSINR